MVNINVLYLYTEISSLFVFIYIYYIVLYSMNLISKFFKILSRAKPAHGPSTSQKPQPKRQLPQLDDFLQIRDFTGAMCLLEVFLLYSILLFA